MFFRRNAVNKVILVVLFALLLVVGRSNLNFFFQLNANITDVVKSSEDEKVAKAHETSRLQRRIEANEGKEALLGLSILALDSESVEKDLNAVTSQSKDANNAGLPINKGVKTNYVAWGNLFGRKGSTSLLAIRLSEFRNMSVFDAQERCNRMYTCVGVAENFQYGYQLLDKLAYPLRRKSDWIFWAKVDEKIGQGEGFRPAGLHRKDEPLYNSNDLPKRPGLKSFHGTRSNKGMVLNRRTNGDGFRFITFEWNVGRLNNQLLSLEGTMGLAKWYKRVLVIPGPQGIERGMENQFLGFRSGMWDMEYLGTYFDWIFQEDLPRQYQQWELSPSCMLAHNIGYNIPPIVLESCINILLLETRTGIVKFDSVAWGLVKYLMPSRYIREIAEDFTKAKFGGVLPEIGAHNRMMKEGGVEGSQVYLCRQSKYSAHGAHGGNVKRTVDRVLTSEDASWSMMHAYYLSCAFNSTDLGYILEQHHREMPSKFFLATDNQDPARTMDLIAHGAVLITPQEFEKVSRWRQHSDWLKTHNCRATNCFSKYYIQSVERALVDMLILSKVSYFVGSWASTFTINVCKWRGFERRKNSTLCYLEERWEEAASIS